MSKYTAKDLVVTSNKLTTVTRAKILQDKGMSQITLGSIFDLKELISELQEYQESDKVTIELSLWSDSETIGRLSREEKFGAFYPVFVIEDSGKSKDLCLKPGSDILGITGDFSEEEIKTAEDWAKSIVNEE